MTWLVWRQHRAQAFATAALLVLLGGLLLAYQDGADHLRSVLTLVPWLAAVPALVGIFWGVPVLALEYERGTNVLAWTQSVSRRRWLLVKLAGLGVLVSLAGLAFGLAFGAWSAGFTGERAADRFANLPVFAVTGVAPAGWWLFAFALGVAAGAVLRRLLPAMAVTLVVFFAVFAAVTSGDVREHYATPVRIEPATMVAHGDEWSVNTEVGVDWNVPAGALIVDSGWTDAAGHRLDTTSMWACASDPGGYFDCMNARGYQWFADYQPADRYWSFQWLEAGVLFLVSLALAAVAVRRVP
ncbi:ABC transporter permease [Actinophytocola sp.]|jgi:hypothetical protein|uniref:ABC transporter permease n=1 Tax=Actinophytocola sp. TaxID=1872138 RepID=UPI002EDA72DF